MTLKLTQLSLLCPVCGAEVPPSGRRGPRRTYCSEACKQAAYRRRARGAPKDLPRQVSTDGAEPWWWDRKRRWRFPLRDRLHRLQTASESALYFDWLRARGRGEMRG